METASKKLRQELKLEQEQLKMTGSESDKLSSVMNSLQKQYEVAQQKTAATAAQLEAVKKKFGESSVEAAKMETKLRSLQIAEQQLANRIQETGIELEKTKQAESGVVSEAEKYKQAMAQLQAEQTKLKSSSDLLSSEYNLLKASMGAGASEAEKLSAAENHVARQTEVTKQVIANLERQLSLTEQEFGKNSTEANQMSARINAAKTSVANMTNELERLKKGGADSADGMDELGKKISAGNFMQAAEILSGVADKVIQLGQGAVQTAMGMSDSQQSLQSNLGLTAQEAESLGEVVKTVFEQGVTESMASASKAVQDVKMYMGDLNDSDLASVTDKVIAIGKHTETDVKENVRAASQIMTNFGVSGTQALDLIAAGFQGGLNRSGDLLDTLNEYSPQFAQAEFSAQDMFSIIDAGMKSGSFNTDKAADSVKEFGIRLKDGTIAKSIGLYSQSTQDLFKQFQSGKSTAAQVFQAINADISKTDDQTKKYKMGNAAMGTMFEDLGNKAVSALSNIGNGFDNVTGKADQMAQRSPGENWQQSLRELQDSLIPIGEDLVATFTPVLDMLSGLGQWFSSLPAPVRIFTEVLGALIVGLVILTPVIAAVAIAVFTLDTALLPIIAIIVAVAAIITIIILAIKNWGAIVKWLSDMWSGFVSWISGFWDAIVAGVLSFLQYLWNLFLTYTPLGIIISNWNTIVNFFIVIWLFIQQIFQLALQFIMGFLESWGILAFFQNVWTGIVSIWTAISAFFQWIFQVIYNFFVSIFMSIFNFLMPINLSIYNFLTSTWQSISSGTMSILLSVYNFIVSIWNKVYGFIAPIVTSIWNTISSGFNSARNTVFSVFDSIYNAIVGKLNSAWSFIMDIIGKIKNIFSGLSINLPHIPLPHFTVTGSFSLNPPQVPKLAVDWYANGGFFDVPSIIGIGEAGPEAALPLSGSRMDPFADSVANRMLSHLPEMVQSNVEQKANNRTTNLTIIQEIDGHELARYQVDHINELMGKDTEIKVILDGG